MRYLRNADKLSRLPNMKTKSSGEDHIPASYYFQCTDRQHEVCQIHQRNRSNSKANDLRSNALTKVLPMWRRNKLLETISYVHHNVRIAMMDERISGETFVAWVESVSSQLTGSVLSRTHRPNPSVHRSDNQCSLHDHSLSFYALLCCILPC